MLNAFNTPGSSQALGEHSLPVPSAHPHSQHPLSPPFTEEEIGETVDSSEKAVGCVKERKYKDLGWPQVPELLVKFCVL